MAEACISSLYKGSDETSFQDCDVCICNDMVFEAVAYCTTCVQYLCMTCENVHRSSRHLRIHKLLTGSNMPSKSTSLTMFCEDHNTMIVNCYCQSHDDIICNTCKFSGHRLCHTTDINQQAQQMRKDGSFKDTKSRLEDLKNKSDKLKKSSIKVKRRIKSELEKCLQDMRQIRTDINEALDQVEDSLSKEILQVNESTTNVIKNHNAILDDARTQILDHLKSLKECEQAQEYNGMYVGMKKASNITSKYEDIISKMEDELNPTKITFQINGKLYDMLNHLRSIYAVLIDNSPVFLQTINSLTDGQGTSGGILNSRQTQKSLINPLLYCKYDVDVGATGVFGCTFMPDGHLVLCCGDDGLKLLYKDLSGDECRLDVNAHRVAVINRSEIVIVSYGEKQVQRVKVFPSMEVTKKIRTSKSCFGVDVSGDEIYVTCHDGSGNGEVRVLNMDGVLLRTLKADLKIPDYVTVNKDGSKIFVADFSTGIVTCLHKSGIVIYQYSDTDLRYPAGMYVDRKDNLLVCGEYSNNVHVIRQDGRMKNILLSKSDGIESPWCIAFRQSDSRLVVGMNADTTQSLISFKSK